MFPFEDHDVPMETVVPVLFLCLNNNLLSHKHEQPLNWNLGPTHFPPTKFVFAILVFQESRKKTKYNKIVNHTRHQIMKIT